MDEIDLRKGPDHDHRKNPTVMARGRASAFALILSLLAVIFATLGINDSLSQQWSDIAKVVAVALFVGAMVALATGMIGGAYDRK